MISRSPFAAFAAVLYLCAAPAHATCWGTNENSGSATTITVSVTPNSGDLLYAFARHGTNTTASITLSDNSGSNSWSTFGSLIANSGVTSAAQVGYAANVASGTYTVTATFGASVAFRSVFVCNLAGMATSAPTDGSGATCNTGGSTSCTSGTFSTTNANDALVFACTVDSSSPTFTAGNIGGSAATLRATSDNDAGTEDRTVSSTQSSITAAMSVNTSRSWMCQAVAFKQAGGGTTPAPQLMMTGAGD